MLIEEGKLIWFNVNKNWRGLVSFGSCLYFNILGYGFKW